ncbi:hypothetical protein ACWD4B_26040 [Streptomyces sp. NPDC002536]
MPPTPTPAQRSPEEINRSIRAFLTARGGRALTRAERKVYEELLAEWHAAEQRRQHCRAAC